MQDVEIQENVMHCMRVASARGIFTSNNLESKSWIESVNSVMFAHPFSVNIQHYGKLILSKVQKEEC